MQSPCEYKGEERRRNCEFADASAEAAVRKVFNILGVDVENPQQVERFRISLRFSDKFSKFVDKGFFASATILATFIALILGYGFIAIIAEKLKLPRWW